MTEMETDDSWEFEGFRVIAKLYDEPEKLTPIEKKRLRELGLDVE